MVFTLQAHRGVSVASRWMTRAPPPAPGEIPMRKLSLDFFGRVSLKMVCTWDSLALWFLFCLRIFCLAELKNIYDL